MWIQYLIVQVWSGCRLATSSGVDVDSFVNDFNLTRLQATNAVGVVTFSRFSTSTSALIVPYINADGSTNTAGAVVITADQTQSYGVSTDVTNAAWNATMGGYLMGAGVASLNVPVAALTAGSAGNIQPNTISIIASAIPGVTSVTNAAAFADGTDAETDAALKARFSNYITTRSLATPSAIEYAIITTQPNLTYYIAVNSDTQGNVVMGNFVVTIDDGSGDPPTSLMQAVTAAINAVRPICSTFTVQPPTVLQVTISMTLTVGPSGNSKAICQAEVLAAISTYVNSLPVGSPLPYSKIAALAYGADTNITNVSSILVTAAPRT